MKQDITFAKMKLTNSKTPEGDQVVLSSMHKYQPRLVVSPQDGSFEPQIFSFPETEFIAVTAYLNTTVSQECDLRCNSTSGSPHGKISQQIDHANLVNSRWFQQNRTYDSMGNGNFLDINMMGH